MKRDRLSQIYVQEIIVGAILVEFTAIYSRNYFTPLDLLGLWNWGACFTSKLPCITLPGRSLLFILQSADADDDYAGTKTAVQNEAIGAGINLVPDRDVVVNGDDIAMHPWNLCRRVK